MLGIGPPAGPLEVLALGAHPDDIEIGCGGTLLQLAARPGASLRGAILTGTPERREEATSALSGFFPGARLEASDLPDGRLPEHWGEVKGALHDLAVRVDPDVVLCPRVDDAHQDHRLVGRLASTVWRNALILHYEIPKWDGDLRPPTHYVPLTAEQARQKVALLNKHYPSQHGRDWWDDEFFLGLMRIRGAECRGRYAEGFVTQKVTLDLT
jgi:LmbE family N-acetylglucosaminyl deacetylase